VHGLIALLIAGSLAGEGMEPPPSDATPSSIEGASGATEAPREASSRERRRRRRDGPEGPEPAPALGDLSQRGTDNGALEIGLGATAIVVTGALIAHGIYQIFEGRRKEEICLDRATDPPECTFDGPNLRYAGAGLSFGFAVPVAVGAALFLRKGIRINRDYKAYRKRAVQIDGVGVWARAREDRGAGVRFSMRF